MADKDNKKGLFSKEGLKNNPITGFLYSIGKGAGTTWEKGKTRAFKADISNMMEKLKTQIIKLFKNITESLNKQANETGKKVMEGKVDKKEETMEVVTKKDMAMPGKEDKGIVKDTIEKAEKNMDKDSVMKRTSDLSKTIESASAKAAPGMEVAAGGPAINNPGLDIGKNR